MAKPEFKTVGKIASCEVKPFGYVFRINVLDGSGIKLPYAIAVNTPNEAGLRFAQHRLAVLALAVDMPVIRDTDELLGLECIVEHDGTAVATLRPVKVIQYVPIERPSLWQRIKERVSGGHHS
ncbi:hypothetical protein UFOVP131_8 [uncultured Caudovirales phage]|uniref:Uncharacterized protein n=1 Tax=uncultured Caudovirales phage TaxID=2100421 RepID=A0A6J5LF84_9CAUD|nr:hypothetical protein UFOVP131_8 [uncultured Caudovirales phage]